MIKTITAIEHDGLDIRTITAVFTIPSPDFDIISAVKAASNEYIATENGKRTLEHNCGYFNFADFLACVPEEICKKHGFTYKTTGDMIIDWDESLIDIED